MQLEITTEDGKSDYALKDVVKFKLNYTSTEVATYKAELDTDWNAAGVADSAVIQFPDKQIQTVKGRQTFVCCASSLQYLNVSPISTRSSIMLGGFQPGEYKIFIQTRRVFAGHPRTLSAETNPLTVTSKILSIHFH